MDMHLNTNGSSNGHTKNGRRPVVITGGAGFVGTNLAHHFLTAGKPVLVYDNLSRPGVKDNLQWLRQAHGTRVKHYLADIRDAETLKDAVQHADSVFHLAAQVAVTTSLDDPAEDFEVNVQGTLNLLEALRHMENPPPLVFTSTNKVYGRLESIALEEGEAQYAPADDDLKRSGINESQPLDFCSPYGCSKGAADQYVLDYAHSYGLPAVVFRMSCIYGMHQHGTEDQGWIAHFARRMLANEPITLFGDGKQVRDVLFAQDLVHAFILAREHISRLSGEAFNIGGGPSNAVSLLDVIDLLSEMQREAPDMCFSEWREGDQRYYVSNTGKFSDATGWMPTIGIREGLARMYDWLRRTQRSPAPILVPVTE